MNFRQAIKQAVKDSKLSYYQRAKLNAAMLIPSFKKKIEEKILAEAKIQNVVHDTLSLDDSGDFVGSINWDTVIDFIKNYLPVLIQILVTILM